MNTLIYALACPITSEIRYVGKTVNPRNRYSIHCAANGRTHKDRWVKSLKPLRPEMIELELSDDWEEAEPFWIAYFRSLGARLTNHTNGGEGNVGFKHSPESIAKIKQVKTNPSPETRAKIAEANRRRSPESWEKMAASKRGKKQSPEHVAKKAMALKGRKRSEAELVAIRAGRAKMTPEAKAEMIAKISTAQKGRKLSEERLAKMRGVKRSPETIEKMRLAGANISDETRAKMSASAKAYQERKRLAATAP